MTIGRTLRRGLLAALAISVAFAQGDFKEVENRISDFTLKNGLKFIVMERHQAPVASFYTYVDVGAVNEVTGQTGIAHMFEHMAFKGTTKIGTKSWAEEKLSLRRVDDTYNAYQQERDKGALADKSKLEALKKEFEAAQEGAAKLVETNEVGRIIEESGGRGLNASTSWDKTDYFFSLPSNQAELWFYLESERFYDPVFREFYKERDVIAEERRMRTDSNPIGRFVEDFLSTAYKAHPYGRPVIGHMTDINHYTREQAEAFYKKYYVPSNMVCVVVGDVNPAEIKRLAEKYFERLPGAPKPAGPNTIEPPQESEKRITLRAQSQPLVIVGYKAAGINDPDYPIYETISSLLSEGRSSRMYRSLVRDQKVAVQAAGFPGFPGIKYPGMFLFFALNAPGKKSEEVEKAMLAEIEKLKNEPVSAEELEGVRTRARVSLLRTFNGNTGMASQLAAWQALTGDWRNLFRYQERFAKVTAADIQRVAKEAFVDSNRTVGYLEPQQNASK